MKISDKTANEKLQLFSSAGLIMSRKRTKLRDKHFENLVLQANPAVASWLIEIETRFTIVWCSSFLWAVSEAWCWCLLKNIKTILRRYSTVLQLLHSVLWTSSVAHFSGWCTWILKATCINSSKQKFLFWLLQKRAIRWSGLDWIRFMCIGTFSFYLA